MGGHSIFDREQYIELLLKRTADFKEGYRQNIALIGSEFVGKTSIIHKFLDRFYDNRCVSIYVEARVESLESFARRFIGSLLYSFLAAGDFKLKEDINFLIDKAGAYLPRTVEAANAVLADVKKKKEGALASLFFLCDILHTETGKFCVVILDEFQNLEKLGLKHPYREWSQLIMLQKKTMYIVASSFRNKAKSVLARDLSLLFGNFEVIDVEPFNIAQSGLYLDRELGGFGIDHDLKNFLVDFTGGYPYYIKTIAQALRSQPLVSVEEVLEQLLFCTSGSLYQRFALILDRFSGNRFSQQYFTILRALSRGVNKSRDLAHVLKRTKQEIDQRLAFLLESELISKSGDFLRVNDRMFAFWIKFVYGAKLESLTYDASNQKAVFRDSITRMISEFIASSGTPVSQRLAELLRMFSDERIQLESRKMKLSHFREIKPLEFSHRGLKEGFICRSSDSVWIFAVKKGTLTEEDITEFSRECRKYRSKLERKIIVTLGGMDATTHLRALEEKVITWNVESLNRLFELFSRPRMVSRPLETAVCGGQP